MDEVAVEHLRSAIAQCGPELYTDWTRTQGALNDVCGEKCGPDKHRREIAALTCAVQKEVPTALRTASRPLLPSLGDQLIRKLTNSAIDYDAARWAVRSWAVVAEIPGIRFSAPSGTAWTGARSAPSAGFAEAAACAARLANAAAQAATSLAADIGRAAALAAAAAALAQIDADRSSRLVSQIDGFLRQVTREDRRILQQYAVVVRLAATHPWYAEPLAMTMKGELRDHALAALAAAIGRPDFDGAQRVAGEISDEARRMHALGRLVIVTADADWDRAVRRARLFTRGYWLAETLCDLTASAAADDTATAALVSEAQGLARVVTDRAVRAAALGRVARALLPLDGPAAVGIFGEAERLARSVPGSTALGSLAVTLATADPDQALSIAAELPGNWYAMGEIAKLVAPSRPDLAVRVALSINPQTAHLADVATALAYADPDGALLLARSLKDGPCQADALAGIARTLAETEPDRAVRLLEEAERLAVQWPGSLSKATVLASLALAWTASS
jgi:hypothetical protein